MTYYISGSFDVSPSMPEDIAGYVNDFSKVRHVRLDEHTLKRLDIFWDKHCFNGSLGKDGMFYLPIGDISEAVIDNNDHGDLPGLWCDWSFDNADELACNYETDEHYIEWLEWIITNFIEPCGCVVNGCVEFEGEDSWEFGKIIVEDNKVRVVYGRKIYDDELSPEEVIGALLKGGNLRLMQKMISEYKMQNVSN